MPTLRQFEYLVAVDDERHFGRASQRVNVSQPTLSAQLNLLEKRIGVQLFKRGRDGVYPTLEGREIISRARKILNEVNELVEFAHGVSHPLSGRLKFGIPPTLGPYMLPHIIPEIHRMFPNLKLLLREGAPRELQRMVEDGALDLAITPLPVMSNKIHVENIFLEDLQVGMAWDHPLAKRQKLISEDLKGEKILALQRGHHLHDQVKELCRAYQGELLYDYEGSSLDALRHMVVMGAGISFFPAMYLIAEIRQRGDLSIKKIEDDKLRRQIAMIWRKDSDLKDEYSDMAELFKSSAAEILSAWDDKFPKS
ncbi:MAG: LysR substrate-binding domain-containing protein [Alphaproteobacteria bacterium]|nr:LysR substrate-binding domain-containing protein [Alphaproteobacteria bacterium]